MSTTTEKPSDDEGPSSALPILENEEEGKTDFPEGGMQAWLTILGATLVQFVTYTNSFGVYQGKIDFYVREYLPSYTPADIGWIIGVQLFLVFLFGVITGPAFDRGYFHHLMIGGAILFIFSFFMLSLSHQDQYYQVFLSHGLGAGIATGAVYIPSLAIVSHYFKRHRTLGLGIVACGTALGSIVHPIMLNQLFEHRIGFHNGVRISAAMNGVLLIFANLIMRTRLPPKKGGPAVPVAAFFREMTYVASVTGNSIIFLGLFFPLYYIQLSAVYHGVNPSLAFYLIAIFNGSSICGRVILSGLAQKYGAFNLGVLSGCVSGCVYFAFGALETTAGYIVFSIVTGFLSGGFIALVPSMFAMLAKDTNELGARMGISFAISAPFSLVSIPITGALLTPHFHWWRPVVFAGVTTSVGCAVNLYTRFVLAKDRGTPFV